MYTVQARIYENVYFNDIRMYIWYHTYLCHKAAPGSTLELYNQISFAYHLLQIVEVEQERMTEIWDTLVYRCSHCSC